MRTKRTNRSSGLLLPIAALPGGKLGRDAFAFVDFLERAGQRWWQVLPLGPPGYGRSPYSSCSAFAGDEGMITGRGKAPTPAFRRRNSFWLKDYCRFRDASDPARHEALQFAFDRQWRELKRYANDRGVGLIGDLPFFVARDSADVAAHPEEFKLNVQAGVPPDYFSETGQLWGNPHYTWKSFSWWRERMKRAFFLFDMVRLDHFLGFARAWEVPGRAKTAKPGRWVKGPGGRFFAALGSVGKGKMIAEDLGLVTPQAEALRKRYGLLGTRVLHFSFGEDQSQLPHDFDRDCVVYTGTHDNDTSIGWHRNAGASAKRARTYAGCQTRDIHWGLIRVAHTCPAQMAIIPVQDVLGLGSAARTNTPGTTRGNWKWRLRRGQLTAAHARRLREITEAAGRG